MTEQSMQVRCFTKMELLKKLGMSYYNLQKLFKVHGEPPFIKTSERTKLYEEKDIRIWFDAIKLKSNSDYDRLKNMLGE